MYLCVIADLFGIDPKLSKGSSSGTGITGLAGGSIATFLRESTRFRFLSTLGELLTGEIFSIFTGEIFSISFSGLTITLGGVFSRSGVVCWRGTDIWPNSGSVLTISGSVLTASGSAINSFFGGGGGGTVFFGGGGGGGWRLKKFFFLFL